MSIGLRRLVQVSAFIAIFCLFGFSTAQAETPCEPLASDKGQLSFTVHTEEAGTYNLWLRMVNPAAGSDSLYVKIDDQCPVATGDGPAANGLVWVNYASGTPAESLTFILTAGDHTVTFAGRDAKTGLDKFTFIDNQQCVPFGEGANCPVDPTAEEPSNPVEAIAQNSLLIFIICMLLILGALGFLIWKYYQYTKNGPVHTIPTPDGMVVSGAPGLDNRLSTKLGDFVAHHRITVAVCTAIILGSIVTMVAFAATANPSFEAEDGTLSGGAQIVDDANASNGKYVMFDTNPAGSAGASGGSSGSTSGGTGGTGGGGSSGGGSGGGGGGDPTPGTCSSFPDDDCTGYEYTGVSLHACSLPLVNPTYDSCLFTGEVNVSASNITVTRSKIVGVVNYRSSDSGSLRGLTLTDVEIDSTGWHQAAIGNNDFTCTRCHIHGGQRGANLGSNVTVQDSYLHGWYYSPGDHITGLSGHGGSNNTVKHNNISCDIVNDPGGAGCSAGMSVYGDDSPGNDNWSITNNLFNSGSSYCVTILGTPSKPYPFTNIVFTNNKFGSDSAAYWGVSASQCTEFGPINTQSGSWGVNGNVWSGNLNAVGGTVNP